MTSKLALYNDTLLLLGERKLSSLTEATESRRILDTIWEAGALDYCLEQGLWNFAVRTALLQAETGIAPDFGFSKVFRKPTDMIRTKEVSTNEYFQSPLLEMSDEAGFIFADFDQIYIRYISNDVQYGGDFSLWPKTFQKYVAAYMAVEACQRISQSDSAYGRMYDIMNVRKRDALSKDAMQNPIKFPPLGSWNRSRFGRNTFGNTR